jgi:hypothetical protein
MNELKKEQNINIHWWLQSLCSEKVLNNFFVVEKGEKIVQKKGSKDTDKR